jgi:hypothetical protein
VKIVLFVARKPSKEQFVSSLISRKTNTLLYDGVGERSSPDDPKALFYESNKVGHASRAKHESGKPCVLECRIVGILA